MIQGHVRVVGDHRAWLALLFVAVSLSACTSDEAKPDAAKAGIAVRLVLVPDGSGGCCNVISVNEEGREIAALCEVTAFDPDGHLVFAGLVPSAPPGERRSPFAGGMGLLAPPGRHRQARADLPIDLTRDTYRFKCRVTIWHGAPPL